MMRRLVIATVVVGSIVPAALAQETTDMDTDVAGETVETIVAPPPEVRTYVIQNEQPSVTIGREVVVGAPLPDEVILYRVPRHRAYEYGEVNNQRVIVDARTRRIVEIVQ